MDTEQEAKEPKHILKNVYVGTNPHTGRKYFERRKVRVNDPNDPSNVPTMDELPPGPENQPLYKSKEEASKVQAEKMEKAWEAHTSKEGRPPIGGCPDD